MRSRAILVAVIGIPLAATGCAPHPGPEAGPALVAPTAPAAASTDPCAALPAVPLRYAPARRLVAIGDLHGDLAAARAALRLAGAIDAGDAWIGGELVVVQTGDILDRGGDEAEIFALFERLETEARAAGGAVHVLNGNHETMNASGDLRYVTAEGFADFASEAPASSDGAGDGDGDGADAAPASPDGDGAAEVPPEQRGRLAAFAPGGSFAVRLARHNVVIIVGDTVFVHGGVLPGFDDARLDVVNRDTRCWLAGLGPQPAVIDADDSPLWDRSYSEAPERCDLLDASLQKLHAARMVVGHTPQMDGITSACAGRVWRIDTGLSAHYGGPTQVLELDDDRTPRVLGVGANADADADADGDADADAATTR